MLFYPNEYFSQHGCGSRGRNGSGAVGASQRKHNTAFALNQPQQYEPTDQLFEFKPVAKRHFDRNVHRASSPQYQRSFYSPSPQQSVYFEPRYVYNDEDANEYNSYEPRHSRHHHSKRKAHRQQQQQAEQLQQLRQLQQMFPYFDEDEINALRAYREAKQREAELNERRQQAALRRRAEAERIAKAQAQAEAQRVQQQRLQEAVEANARAAARAYIRRKQQEAYALQQAEYNEKKQQQQAALEQLLNPANWSNYYEPAVQDKQQHQDDAPAPETTEATLADEDETSNTTQSQQAAEAVQKAQRDQQDAFIRMLVDSFAPAMVRADESSDEEETNPQTQSGESQSKYNVNQNRQEDTHDQAYDSVAEAMRADSEEEAEEDDATGPHCETASENSDAYVELVDPQSVPPITPDEVSEGVDDEDEFVKKPKRRSPIKANRGKRSQKKAKRVPIRAVDETASAETVSMLNGWAQELKRIKEAEIQFADGPIPDTNEAIVKRKKTVKSLYSATEKIYNKLDELKVNKNVRKTKHQLTSEAVALADKLEILLLRLDEMKQDRPKYHVTLEDVTDDDSM